MPASSAQSLPYLPSAPKLLQDRFSNTLLLVINAFLAPFSHHQEMAEGVLFDIAGKIISLGGGLAAEEIKLIFGARDDLQKLTETVSTIKAVLLDAEEQQYKNREVKVWLEKLSDILGDVDDLLDAGSTEAMRRQIITKDKKAKKVRIFFSKSNQLAFRRKMGRRVKEINERLDAIKDVRELHLHERLADNQMRSREGRETHSDVIAKEVFGREHDKKNVIKYLMAMNDEENASVLPIVGIGGLGKTTLAKLVFNDERIQKHFELKMWVCVSEPFDVKDIIEKILEVLKKVKPEPAQLETQKNKLKEEIATKKYFLVLDDVWNEDNEKWFDLKTVLMGGAKGSRILATTRSKRVAGIMLRGKPFCLEGLGEKESEDLFKQMAFPDGKWPENPRIQEVGRDIIIKCAGVPLAVKTMGRSLYFKNSETEWQDFLRNDLSNIDQGEFDILPTLKLSYNKLPSHLKQCFAYCSLYPKDYEYDRATMINEWIAHGFVESSSTNQSLEDVGNDYFMDLLWRSFFQDPKKDIDHVVIGCKMHDLMHDLAISVMAGSLITSNENEWKINKKTRYLSICSNLEFLINELISQCEEKRIIRAFGCPYFGGEIDCEIIFSSFKFLRVLNLGGNNLEHVPNTIGNLKHLRFLNLSSNNIKVLPSSCTKLVNLQFLKLNYCVALTGLPRGIKNLVNLRCLNLDGCMEMTYLSHRLRKSISLHRLKQFRVNSDSPLSDNASLSEFKELNKLGGSLIIWNLRHSKDVAAEYKVANIKEKTGLKSLKLHFSSSDKDHDNDVEDKRIFEGLQPHANLKELEIDSCRSVMLPSWILSTMGLVKLRLSRCKSYQYLPHVNQLRSLKELYLSKMIDLVYISNCSEFYSSSSASTENSFQSLFKITILDCPKLKGWLGDSSLMVDSDSRLLSFPVLSKVLIERCCMLIFLPLPPQLCFLEEICLKKMDALEYLFNYGGSEFSSSSSASIENSFRSLSKITFLDCLKLKGWLGDSSLMVNSDSRLLSFPMLSNVLIERCYMLTFLPLPPQLCFLEEICLKEMDALEYLFDCDRSEFSSSSLASTQDFFQSLSNIYLKECPKLKGWWRDFSLEVHHDNGPHTLPLFPQLSKVWIQNCPQLTSLPLSPQSPLLKEVSLFGIDVVEYVFNDNWSDSSASIEAFCPSLSQINFVSCPKLKGWWRDFSLEVNCTLPLFPKLSHVTITNCALLSYLPLSPHIEWLRLVEHSGKSLEQIMMVKMPAGTTNSVVAGSLYVPLSKLKEITLCGLSDLETLQEEWLKYLTSLNKLYIYDCSKLKSLSLGIQHLTALENLSIRNCLKLEPLGDERGKCWAGLKSLLYLTVENLSKWVSLPLGLQQVSTLQQLWILDCENLTTILESIHHWKSLKEVTIRNCPDLIELPKGIQSLSSLQKLEIKQSLELLKSVLPRIQHLTALKSLTIGNCSGLDPPSDEHGMCWERLKSLILLRVENLSKWGSLPSGLQRVGILRALYISECESLTTILESIRCWKSFEMLVISNCHRLTELPEGIQSLSSLQWLRIKGCPILLQKYKKDEGVNWSKIAHIPKLELDCSYFKERYFASELFHMETCLEWDRP